MINMYKTGIVIATILNVRSGPSLNHSIVGYINVGRLVSLVEIQNNFYRIGDTQWVSSDWVKEYDPDSITLGVIDPIISLAFLQVESNNHAFSDDFLVIRFEVHRFQTFLRNDAVFNQHFRFNGRNYNEQFWRINPNSEWVNVHRSQRERHQVLNFARSLDDTSALNATGMGLGQIMGHNARRVGYSTPQQMFNAFSHLQFGYTNQVIGFMNYILSDDRLYSALQRKDYHRAIQLYNGLGQEHIYLPRLTQAIDTFNKAF